MATKPALSRREEISQYYSQWWENPRDIRNVVFDALNRYVRQRIPPGEGKKALDIGAGKGRIVSYLLEKGYQVTAVEFNPEFVRQLKQDFPTVRIIDGDACEVDYNEVYDLATCIQVLPMIGRGKLPDLLQRLCQASHLFLTNVSNRRSLHGSWIQLRNFRNSFIDDFAPEELDHYLETAGFEIVHRHGVGLVTPLSLWSGFRGRFIPLWFARLANHLDGIAPRLCHLYHVEAKGKPVVHSERTPSLRPPPGS